MLLENLHIIPADKKSADYIPEVLKKAEYIKKQDWNYNTIVQTAQKFDQLRAKHPDLEAKKFWNCIMRSGIQGAVYYCDSLN